MINDVGISDYEVNYESRYVVRESLVPCFVSWRGIIDAGADMVRLYGHLVPKLALSVFMELVPLPSDWDRASCALCNFFMNVSLFRSVFLKSASIDSSISVREI